MSSNLFNADLNQNRVATTTLKVEGLTVYQGSYSAVQDVSFELMSGTDTAVVGPNGAGKSTLVQAILGLLPRAAGNVEIFGRPLKRLGRLRQQIGYVPQNFIFDRGFPLSVGELVGLGWIKPVQDEEAATREKHTSNSLASHPKEAKSHLFSSLTSLLTPLTILPLPWRSDATKSAAIAQALERVDAYHLRHRAIGTLSGGELKRVLLAYCLVIPRKLLVLDEAFAGVDVQGEADFYILLNQLKQEQSWTVLQVSHDLDMVSRHCDRVLCLNRNLICHGQPDIALSPQNLLNAYGPAYSRYQHQH